MKPPLPEPRGTPDARPLWPCLWPLLLLALLAPVAFWLGFYRLLG